MLQQWNIHEAPSLLDKKSKKDCSLCDKLQPISSFHLKGTDRSGLPRFQSTCKTCANKKRQQRYLRKKAELMTKRRNQSFRTSLRVEIVRAAHSSSQTINSVLKDYIEAICAITIESKI